MSAFVVDTAHIDAMVQAGLRGRWNLSWYWEGEHHELTRANADEIGAMLLAENVRSVDHRYSPPGREAIYGEGWETPEQNLPGRYVTEQLPGIEPISFPQWLTPYRYTEPRRSFSPVAILKAIDCYEYQSCEHDEWRESQAFTFCRALRSWCIGKLEGYEAADWEISS